MESEKKLMQEQANNLDTLATHYGLPTYSELLAQHEQRQKDEERDAERLKNAREQCEAQARSIGEMVAAMNCDYDRLEELQHDKSQAAFSVEVRSEFMILLCTGGPAVRIRGELDQYKQPCRAWLEYQDWFTAWTEYHGDAISRDDLLAYCQVFYFGE